MIEKDGQVSAGCDWAAIVNFDKLLSVQRACTCGAVKWTETLDTTDARERMLQVQFKKFSSKHTAA